MDHSPLPGPPMTPARFTVYPVHSDAQIWPQPIFIPRLPRRHPPAGASQLVRVFCLAVGPGGVSCRYSFVHTTLLGTLFELLSLWFLAGFLEGLHTSSWVTGLYAASVLGTAVAATAFYAASGTLGFSLPLVPLYGCFGGIFGLLVAIGALYGDMEFLLFFTIGIKARYLVGIYALVSIAMLFGELRVYAFAQLGGALAGLLYLQLAPRRGLHFVFSERWYAVRNRYYRWKRRRAGRKFEVYMRSQGRNVHLDGRGRQIDDDQNDKKRWN